MDCINFNGNLPPALSAEENTRLLEVYKKTGDLDIKEKIILGNLRLVSFAIKRMPCDFGSIEEDAYSLGIIELSRAIEAFDLTKSNNFSTYAVAVIRKNIFTSLKRQYAKRIDPISFEEPLSNFENEEITLQDCLSDCSEDPQLWDQELYNQQLISEVNWYLSYMVGPNKKFIMEHMWGINGCEHLDGLTIANRINKSKSYVYVVYHATVNQIRNHLIDRGLVEGKKGMAKTKIKKDDLSL